MIPTLKVLLFYALALAMRQAGTPMTGLLDGATLMQAWQEARR
jgi:hypothetical protein